jgi:RNA polymerase sigma-32 factor
VLVGKMLRSAPGLHRKGRNMAMMDMPATQRANREFIRGSMSVALLTREREQDLARRWRGEGDEVALHELVLAYMRLVISTATRFRNYGLPMSDLVQEGAVGLMQAAARFEPEREVRFSTYAAWWIRSAMQDYILRNWSVVRTGTTAAQKALFFNFRRLRARRRRKLKNRAFCAAVVPVRTTDQLRRM